MTLLGRVGHTRSLAVGVVCAALALSWQALTVRYNYGGNWSGLFCTGALQRVPRALLSENIYALPASGGYDGQFYHYIAHDLLGRTALPGYVDAPKLRYRRILVPALASLLAAGQPRYIDAAYFAVVLLFVFLGGYWLARFAELHRRAPAWGLLFLFIPAVLTSIDRMTIDVALVALWAGFGVYATLAQERRLWVVLILAPLVRETGFALPATYCLWAFLRKENGRGFRTLLTLTPGCLWYLYVERTFAGYYVGWLTVIPLRGLFDVVVRPFAYPWGAVTNAMVVSGDLLALGGTLLAIALAFRFGIRKSGGILDLALVLTGAIGAVMGLAGSRDIWVHVYGHARLLSPLFLLLAMRALGRGTWSDLLPLPLLAPRIGLQFGSAALRVARGVVAILIGQVSS
jgi:hypothetical protein